jgi:hypothetical protein
MAEETSLSFVLGETWVIDFALNDADGEDLDLSGATVAFRLSRNKVLALSLTSSSEDISVDSPADGNGTITVEPADQAGIVPAVYEYEVRATLQDGSKTTQAYGSVEVRRTLF